MFELFVHLCVCVHTESIRIYKFVCEKSSVVEKTRQTDIPAAVSKLPVVLIERDKDQPIMHGKCNSMFHRHYRVFMNVGFSIFLRARTLENPMVNGVTSV